MTSPTPNKGMTYPAHGGAVGAWDTPLNANFDQLDLNLGGYYPITVTSTATTATYNSSGAILSSTVATATFPTSIAQNLFYNVTGTLTQNLTLTYPAAGSVYIIGNNSSGAFTVTATPSGGTGTAVTQGGEAIVVMSSSTAFPAQNSFDSVAFRTISVSSAATISGILSQNSSGYGLIATGPTASRPTLSSTTSPSSNAGYFRYNTTLDQPEVADDSNNWRQIAIGQPVAAGFKNLTITNNAGTPNTKIDLTADAATVETTSFTAYRLNNVSFTIDCTINGANGLDVGGLANSTFYSVWVIYNPTTNTTAGLASTSATAPTMPSGYTAKARLGWMRTDGSAHFHRTIQKGRRAQYSVTAGSPTTALPIMISGASGSVSIPTWTAVSVSSFVPSTALAIYGVLQNNSGNSQAMCAPTNSYGAFTSSSNPPPVVSDNVTGEVVNLAFSLLLESTNIYYASADAVPSLVCLGWEDNLT